MNLQIFALLLQDGVTTGAIYVLLAVALVMVFAVTRIIMVPQGEFVTFSAFTLASFEAGTMPGTVWILLGAGLLAFSMDTAKALSDRRWHGLLSSAVVNLLTPAGIALVAGLGVGADSALQWKVFISILIVVNMGPILYRIAFEPIADASPLVLLIAAIALHFVLLGVSLLFFGAEGVRTPAFSSADLMLGFMRVNPQTLWVIALSALLIIALFAFFGRSVYGKALRATAVSRQGALLCGISANLAGKLALTIAAGIGALSGVLIGPISTLYYDSGFLLGLKGFVGAIIGGLVAYPAAAAGAVLVGLLEAFSSYWASSFKEIVVFTLIIPVLLWRSLTHPAAADEGEE